MISFCLEGFFSVGSAHVEQKLFYAHISPEGDQSRIQKSLNKSYVNFKEHFLPLTPCRFARALECENSSKLISE